MGVSENSGFYTQIIHFNRVFHYKPSILGYPYFWKHPYSNKNDGFSSGKSYCWGLSMLSWIFFRCCADPPAIFYVKERSDLRLIFNRPFWNIPYITLLQLHFGIVGCQNYPGFLLDFFKNETSLQPFHSTWHVGIMFHTALGFYERRTGLKKTCPTEILFWRMGPPLGRISA